MCLLLFNDNKPKHICSIRKLLQHKELPDLPKYSRLWNSFHHTRQRSILSDRFVDLVGGGDNLRLAGEIIQIQRIPHQSIQAGGRLAGGRYRDANVVAYRPLPRGSHLAIAMPSIAIKFEVVEGGQIDHHRVMQRGELIRLQIQILQVVQPEEGSRLDRMRLACCGVGGGKSNFPHTHVIALTIIQAIIKSLTGKVEKFEVVERGERLCVDGGDVIVVQQQPPQIGAVHQRFHGNMSQQIFAQIQFNEVGELVEGVVGNRAQLAARQEQLLQIDEAALLEGARRQHLKVVVVQIEHLGGAAE